MLNVLFTSIGRRVELIHAFRQAYQALELKGQIIGTDINPLAPALRVVDKPCIVPRSDDPCYIPILTGICQHNHVGLIFPLIDPDILILAAHRASLESTGARLAVVAEEAAILTRDKWQTLQFFQRLGLATPCSWLPDQIDPDRAAYPLFIKPRAGSAGKLAFPVRNVRELTFFLEYVPQPIIQEWLPGPEITHDVTCDLQGRVLAVVSRRRIEVRSGEVAKGVTIYEPGFSEAGVRIAQALPAIGPITVQCMMKDGIPYFTEINARLGGGIPLGIMAGVDSPRYLLASAAGLPVEIPPLGTYKTGLYLTRFDESFFLSKAEYEQMASRCF